MSNRKAHRWFFLLAAGALLPGGCFGGGCVNGKVVKFARYDQPTDSFAFLDVYANINTAKEPLIAGIADLWARRANLIVNQASASLIGSPLIAERLGKHTFREWPIAEIPDKEPPTLTTSVDLDSVRVTPGAFFLNRYGTLCTSLQCVVPGSAVDAMLGEMVPKLASSLGEFVREHEKAASQPGAQVMTWDDYRAMVLASLNEQEPRPALAASATRAPLPLDAESRRLLARAGDDGSIRLARRGDVVTLVIPLSPPDVAQVVALVALTRQEAARRTAAGHPVEGGVELLLQLVEVRPAAGGGLAATIDVGKFCRLAATPNLDAMPPPDEHRKWVYDATIAAIEERGITVNKTDLFPDLVKRFNTAVPRP